MSAPRSRARRTLAKKSSGWWPACRAAAARPGQGPRPGTRRAGFGGLPAAVMAFTGLQGRIGKALDAQLHRAAAVAAQARQQGRIQTVGAGGAAEAGDAAVTPEAVGHVQTGIQVAGRQGREGAAVKGQLYRRPALCPPGVQIGGRTASISSKGLACWPVWSCWEQKTQRRGQPKNGMKTLKTGIALAGVSHKKVSETRDMAESEE